MMLPMTMQIAVKVRMSRRPQVRMPSTRAKARAERTSRATTARRGMEGGETSRIRAQV